MYKLIPAVCAILLASTLYAEAMVRVFVPLGQGGTLTSIGMIRLAQRIRALSPRYVVTTHGWAMGHLPNTLVAEIKRLPANTQIVFVSYSIGVSAALEVAKRLPNRKIALIIAYDPSHLTYLPPVGQNIGTIMLYHNRCAILWGRAIIKGPQVKQTTVCGLHLMIDFNEQLHQRTLKAVSRIR